MQRESEKDMHMTDAEVTSLDQRMAHSSLISIDKPSNQLGIDNLAPKQPKVTSQIVEKHYEQLTNSNHKKVTSAIIPQKVPNRNGAGLPSHKNLRNGNNEEIQPSIISSLGVQSPAMSEKINNLLSDKARNNCSRSQGRKPEKVKRK